GAMESYVLKADRGRAVHGDHILGVDYWVERNFNITEDRSIARYSDQRDAHLGELKADPELMRLHEAAVAWRKARFDVLMQQEPFRALFGRLLMTPPTRVVPLKAAQFMVRYANLARQTTP
ncbi:MAG: glycosyltransferase family 2 protein, partial [Pseudomonadota bacterium]